MRHLDSLPTSWHNLRSCKGEFREGRDVYVTDRNRGQDRTAGEPEVGRVHCTVHTPSERKDSVHSTVHK